MTNEIVFDPNSGISEDEQQKILEQINGIAEKNRQSLAAGTGKASVDLKPRFKAKKTGLLFPVMVNTAAVVILAGGVFALSALHGITDAEVREGAKVYNSTERALIEEIRRETSSRLEEKENEIFLISSQLEEIDAELRELYSSNQELTEEQKETQNHLKALQEDHRSSLANLHNERSSILEEARAREAVLQDQLERRTRELAVTTEQSSAAVESARAELERLTKEQSQSAAVESQMNALFSNLNGKIKESRYDEAAETVKSMRNFIETPSFQSLRSMQARKEMYASTINAFDAMIEDALKNQTGITTPGVDADKLLAEMQENFSKQEKDLQDKVALLEKDLTEKEKTITTLSSSGSDTTRLLAERDNEISSLKSDLTRQTQAAESAQQTINTQKVALDKISEAIKGKEVDDMSPNEIKDKVSQIQAALGN